jgi:hypothetical protein
VQRSGDQSDERFAEQAKLGAVFDLRDFPVTERAVRDASSFAVELGVQGNDQDEETALVIAGYRAVIGAGATAAGSGWLIEVFADTLTLPLFDFEPVLRALVAVAVVGAADPVDPVGVPAARGAEEPGPTTLLAGDGR